MKNFLQTKSEIISWLKRYEINKYEIFEDKQYGFKVDVNESVHLSNCNLQKIPVRFNIVLGNFHCHSNFLKSLDFGPEVVFGHFDCSNNQITSLKNGPHRVYQQYMADCNLLKNLLGCPNYVGGIFTCTDNQLENLDYFPEKITDHVFLSNNPGLGPFQELLLHEDIVKAIKNKEFYYQLHKDLDNDLQGNHKRKI